MQTVTELINQQNFQPSIEQTKKPRNTLRASGVKLEIRAAMTTLWQRMGERYGAAFTNQYGHAKGEAWQTWTLEAQDLSVEMITLGFKNLIASGAEYPPTAPGFINLCQPTLADYGLPDVRSAYNDAVKFSSNPSKRKWSHPAVKLAGIKTNWFVLKSFLEKESYPVFQRNYEVIVKRVIAGEGIDSDIIEALPEKVHVPLTCEENKSRMQIMRIQLGV